ncbi:hypothetical protein HUU53_02470 [Candidatus Micrarchaeota archaeon]|nr:hypothetical protein [Candidatus Micrarchaeota archaeon]
MSKKALLLLVVLAGFTSAACFDVVQFSFNKQVLLSDLNRNISPAPAAVRVDFQKPGLNFTNFTQSYFYVVAEDQYYLGNRIAKAGDIYYQTNEQYSSTAYAYFTNSPNQSVRYKCEAGTVTEIGITLAANTSITLNDSRSLTSDFVRFSSPDYGFAFKNFFTNEVLISTQDMGKDFAAGSAFLKVGDEYFFIGSPYRDRYWYYYPVLQYYSCCNRSCSAIRDPFTASQCESTFVTVPDACDGDYVVEQSCSISNACIGERVLCQYGCVNGACKKPLAETCVDSDDGANEFVFGKTTGVNARGEAFSVSDSCVNSNQLKEYFCGITGSLENKLFDCDCTKGYCIEKPTSTPEPVKDSTQASSGGELLILGVLVVIAFAGYYFLVRKPPATEKPKTPQVKTKKS